MLGNILKMSTGTLLAQLLSFAMLPFFTRFYGDTVIGEWAFIYAIASILCFISDLGLTNAIMLEQTEDQVRQTCRTVRTAVLLLCCVIFALGYAYFRFVSPGALSFPPLASAAFLAFSVFLVQNVSIGYIILNRAEKYTVLMKNQVLQNIAFAIIGIGLAFCGITQYGYFLGWFAGQIAQLIQMHRHIPHTGLTLCIKDFRDVFTRNAHYVKFQMPANVLTQAKTEVPSLLIKAFFGAAVLGQYSIAMRLIQIPATLIGNAIGRVFFSTASALKRENKDLGEFAHKSMIGTMKIAAIPTILILAYADIIVPLYLNPSWALAGALTRIFAIHSFFLFIVFATQSLYVVLKKQKHVIVAGLAQCAAAVATIGTSALLLGHINAGMIGYTVLFCLVQAALFGSMYRTMQIPVSKLVRFMALILFVIIGAAVLLRLPALLFGLSL